MFQCERVIFALRTRSKQPEMQKRRSRIPAPLRRDAGRRTRVLDRVSHPQVLGPLLQRPRSVPVNVSVARRGAVSATPTRRALVKRPNQLCVWGEHFQNGPSFNYAEGKLFKTTCMRRARERCRRVPLEVRFCAHICEGVFHINTHTTCG
jgi:hypothetical protein